MAEGTWLHGTGERVVSILCHNYWFGLNHKYLVNIHGPKPVVLKAYNHEPVVVD